MTFAQRVFGTLRPRAELLAVVVLAAACTGKIGGAGEAEPSSAGMGGSESSPGSGGKIGSMGGASSSGSPNVSGASASGGSAGATTTTPPDTTAEACAAAKGVLNAGLTKVRRLTRDQFNNTVRDLLLTSGTPADALAPDERMGPFASNAVAPITELLVQQHEEVAAKLALDAKSRMAQISPCDLAADTGTTCATKFVTEFGLRAFRRPLQAAEVTDYVALYGVGKQGGGAANGFRLVVEAMLQSPFFLYHHDVGSTGTPQTKAVAVTPYELASRLSYFLWNSMPDAALFGAAGNGTLSDPSVLSDQVERMLNDAKASTTIGLFHRQWLALEDLPNLDKDASAFPAYNAALADAMLQETSLFSDSVVRKGDGLLKTLLTSTQAFPQGGLFQIYGITQPSGFKAGTAVTLNGSERAGILTQAAFLARNAHRDQSSPVHRGLVVRENLLCQTIPSPPANVNNAPPPPSAATSTRERFAQHSADPNCAGCHQLMDPIGVGFEHYDAVGAYRTKDGLGAVDATGAVNGVSTGLNGAFDGAVELASKLAAAPEVENCVANQWFRFSLGRIESTDDACSMQGIRTGFHASGGNIRALLTQIAVSDAFRNVRSTGN
ncbi:MAG TPA: DUF1592 domain-containing protein [Polyangiaceae bacterium]|nr:DUF1592 domain-containing protein [Polyangiaceae bacterium]